MTTGIVAKFALLFLLLTTQINNTSAQVTIGGNLPPAQAAILDLKDKDSNPTSTTDDNNITSEKGGLILPRVKLVNQNTLEPFIDTNSSDWTNSVSNKIKEKHAGLLVYNLYVDSDENGFKQGIYEWDGAKWRLVLSTSKSATAQNFFYMPSFNLALQTIANNQTYNLYDEYKTQFTKSGNSNFVSSNVALNQVPALYNPTELDYIVTDYDNSSIKINSIDQNGVMNYDVLSINPSLNSYINIIFVVKQ